MPTQIFPLPDQTSEARMRVTVERLADGQIRVSKGSWQDTFPEERREAWAAWYEGMHARYGYHGYQEMAEALRALA